MVSLRMAGPADAPALRRLAERDCARLPEGEVLIAIENGEIRAALNPATGTSLADPFVRTSHLAAALRAFAAGEPRRRGGPRRPAQLLTRSILGS